ncbi:MAG TPA: pilus assembly protein TadG-related protein [Pyrinomonadaceae bacterium]|nr:pilus assembly protein TadG-related protein [Pyrinomonadaceae bacterium]
MQLKRHSRASRRKGERGNVLAYTVLSALFLFLAVGLGVDLSHFYLAKTEMQNAADAAALAGASALTLPDPDRITTAVDRAVEILNANKYNFNNKTFNVDRASLCGTGQACVMFAKNLDGTYVSETTAHDDPVNIRFIRVTTPSKSVSVIFASPILGSGLALDAKATAGLSKPGNAEYCPFPLSAVQCRPGTTCEFNSEFWGDCGDAPTGTPPRPPVHTYTDGTPACDPTREFCKGCTYTIRAAGAGGPSPGNLGILGCAGSGCDNVRDALKAYGEGCDCGMTSVGDSMPVQTGACAGPISQGLNVRFDRYIPGGPMAYSPLFPPDVNVEQGEPTGSGANETWPGITFDQYQLGSPSKAPAAGHTGVPERRILVLPITHIQDWPTGSSGTVPARGFGAFFMRSQAIGTNGDVKLEYTGTNVTGITGIDGTGTGTSNIVTPVLYR